MASRPICLIHLAAMNLMKQSLFSSVSALYFRWEHFGVLEARDGREKEGGRKRKGIMKRIIYRHTACERLSSVAPLSLRR